MPTSGSLVPVTFKIAVTAFMSDRADHTLGRYQTKISSRYLGLFGEQIGQGAMSRLGRWARLIGNRLRKTISASRGGFEESIDNETTEPGRISLYGHRSKASTLLSKVSI